MIMKDCPFCKIVEEKLVQARRQAAEIGADLNVAGVIIDAKDPQAPVHKLVILRTHAPIAGGPLLTDLFRMAVRYGSGTRLAGALWEDGTCSSDCGFRIVLNVGPNSGSTIDHPHIHILAGRPLGDICSPE